MSYVWGTQGVGFEYPTCYRIENRFLTLRGGLLLLGALVVLWIALSDPDPVTAASSLITRPEQGNPLPHLIASAMLLVLGVLDLVVAARQRRVLLVPGQPASLAHELSRQASGTSADAELLQRLIGSGHWSPPGLKGSFNGALHWLSDRVALAPVGLQDFMRMRLGHLLFAAAMLVVLALTWAPLAGSAALPIAALLYAGLAAALAARSAWISKSAPGPWALAIAVATVTVVGVLLTLLGDRLPQVGRLRQLELPVATALTLASMLLIEALGLMAARAQLAGPIQASLSKADASTEITTEPTRLMQEVEREMHRFWADGVPNRRHVWEPPAADGQATLLEESQPQALPERAEREGGDSRARPWLLTLDTLGLAMTLLGIGMWVRLAYLHIQNAASPWASGAPAVVLVIAGGYALRVAHLLWSRTEVESLLVAVDFKPVDARPSPLPERPLVLRTRVARLRSVFYIGADHVLGSRTLLRISGDESSARRFVDQVRAYAERSAYDPGQAMRASAVATPPRAPQPQPSHAPALAPGRAVARFCHACGSPLLQSARFCQNCGQAVGSG